MRPALLQDQGSTAALVMWVGLVTAKHAKTLMNVPATHVAMVASAQNQRASQAAIHLAPNATRSLKDCRRLIAILVHALLVLLMVCAQLAGTLVSPHHSSRYTRPAVM